MAINVKEEKGWVGMEQNRLLAAGGVLQVKADLLLCRFPQRRIALSTSQYNGGIQELSAVFNHRLTFFAESEATLPGGSLDGYLASIAEREGLPKDETSGLLTTAHMECMSYQRRFYEGITVEAIVTAGVEHNAARAGEDALYWEHHGEYIPVSGTINILLLVEANLSPGALAKALITATEAKSAALQDLEVRSPHSLLPATGTGTDGIILVSHMAGTACRDVGTQSKLGEMIADAVKSGVKTALFKEEGLKEQAQYYSPKNIRCSHKASCR